MKLVIVGGVAAGATAAARARRLDENAEITILEKGPYVSFANCGLPYRLSRDISKRSALILQTAEGFASRYTVDVRLNTQAVSIDRDRKLVTAKSTRDGTETQFAYDILVLAQGGTPFVPRAKGIDSPHVFQLWTIPDMDGVDTYIEESGARSAVVIGGGFIGLETAEAFIARGMATSIVELTERLMPPADPEFGARIRQAFEEAGATVRTGRSVASIDYGRRLVELDDGTSLPADLVLVAAGVRPNTELAVASGLKLGTSGGLLVDEKLRTSDPSIYAAGDMVEVTRRVDGAKVRIPLAGPANRQGRIAATNALGGSLEYKGALGTSVFKAVDYTFAQTGLTEKAAEAAGLQPRAVYVHRAHHATYYPGSTTLSLKLVYTSKGKLLGAQAFGKEGVEKRIDVLATALAANMGIDDLAELDLAYAPPYSSANDPLQMAAFAARNQLSDFSPTVSPLEAAKAAGGSGGPFRFLDVRTYGEYVKGHVPGSLHIPLDELRDRMEEVPRNEKLALISQAGFEGHLALRQLRQHGVADVAYVSGGIVSMRLAASFEETTGE